MGPTFLLALLSLQQASASAAPVPPNPLMERLAKVDAQSATRADCDTQVAKAAHLNAPDLIFGAIVCFAAKMPVEGSFLLNAGQIRSIPDMSLIVPATKTDSDIVTSLYTAIYFHLGGPGDEQVLRKAGSRDRLFQLLDQWSPEYGPDYDPGWKARRRPEATVYRAAIVEGKVARRQQLDEVSRLYSDSNYYRLHVQSQEILKRHPKGLETGTADGKLLDKLFGEMDERAVALGVRTNGSDDSDRAMGERRFPPASPGRDEVAAESSDPVAQGCADRAERMAIADESVIARVLVTRNPEWGLIWRGDLEGAADGPTRFTCTERFTGHQPLDTGAEVLAPLPGASSQGAHEPGS